MKESSVAVLVAATSARDGRAADFVAFVTIMREGLLLIASSVDFGRSLVFFWCWLGGCQLEDQMVEQVL